MKITVEEGRRIDYERLKPIHKRQLKKSGEAVLYFSLRRRYPDGKIFGMSIKAYVDLLKEEIKQEDSMEGQ